MSFTEDSLKAKLSSLNETQDSIVSVSQWVMFHRRYAGKTAQVWLQRLKDAGAPKRLNLIYLANEVIQQSKARKRDDFVNAFSPVMAEATAVAFKGASSEVQQKLQRVIDVWRQRQIFDPAVQGAIEARAEEADKARAPPKKAHLGGSLFSSSSSDASNAPTELQPLITLHLALSKAQLAAKPLGTEANETFEAEQSLTTPGATNNLSLPVLASRLNALLKKLAPANEAASECVKKRRELVAGLEALLETNKAALAEDEARAADMSEKREQVHKRQQAVEDEIQLGLKSEAGDGHAASGAPVEAAEPERPEVEQLTPPSESVPPHINPVDAGSTTPPEAPPAHVFGYADSGNPDGSESGFDSTNGFAQYSSSHSHEYNDNANANTTSQPRGASPTKRKSELLSHSTSDEGAVDQQQPAARSASPTSESPTAAPNGSPKRRKLSSHHHRPGLAEEEFAGFGELEEDALAAE